MTEEFGWIVCLLLAVYGAMLLLSQLAARLLRPRDTRACWVLPLCGECHDAEYFARAARHAERQGMRVCLVDDGIAPESRVFVESVCRRLHITLISAEELCDFALQP